MAFGAGGGGAYGMDILAKRFLTWVGVVHDDDKDAGVDFRGVYDCCLLWVCGLISVEDHYSRGGGCS